MTIKDKWDEFTDWVDDLIKGPVVEEVWSHNVADTALVMSVRNGVQMGHPIKLVVGEKVELTGSTTEPNKTIEVLPGTMVMVVLRKGSMFKKPSMATLTLRFGQ